MHAEQVDVAHVGGAVVVPDLAAGPIQALHAKDGARIDGDNRRDLGVPPVVQGNRLLLRWPRRLVSAKEQGDTTVRDLDPLVARTRMSQNRYDSSHLPWLTTAVTLVMLVPFPTAGEGNDRAEG